MPTLIGGPHDGDGWLKPQAGQRAIILSPSPETWSMEGWRYGSLYCWDGTWRFGRYVDAEEDAIALMFADECRAGEASIAGREVASSAKPVRQANCSGPTFAHARRERGPILGFIYWLMGVRT